MQLCVFGATGRTGRALVAVALEHGSTVRAFVRARSPALPGPLPGLDVVRGDPARLADVAAALAGSDAVCVLFGPRPSAREPFCAPFTRVIVDAMRDASIHRLVCVTGAMVGTLPANVSVALRAMAAIARRLQPAVMDDRAAQERIVAESGLDWTLVKPPRLTDAAGTGTVHADPALRVGALSRVSRGDLAAFVFRAAAHGRFVHQRVYLRA
jgi:putative NADH-flavin reductase